MTPTRRARCAAIAAPGAVWAVTVARGWPLSGQFAAVLLASLAVAVIAAPWPPPERPGPRALLPATPPSTVPERWAVAGAAMWALLVAAALIGILR